MAVLHFDPFRDLDRLTEQVLGVPAGTPRAPRFMPMDLFRASVQTWPEVVECAALTGEMDYLLRVHVEDLEHFSRFVMEQLLKQPGVVDVKSSFALERIKDTTALPLAHLPRSIFSVRRSVGCGT